MTKRWTILQKLIWLKIKASASAVYETLTGVLVSFTTLRSAPLKDLSVSLAPIQSGSGDPSPTNVRPISGRTGLTVTRAGKNLFHNTATTQTINDVTFTVNSDGTVSTSGTATAAAALTLGSIMLKKGVSYILNGCPSGGSTSRYLISFSGIGFDSGSGYSYTPANDTTAYVVITVFAGINVTGMTFKPMVRFASVSAADYNPYVEPQTFPISWQSEAGTVYGGTLDVTTGVLTVDKVMKQVTAGTSYVTQLGDTTRFYIAAQYGLIDNWYDRFVICNMFSRNAYNADAVGFSNVDTSAAMAIKVPASYGISTASEANSWLATNKPTFVYALATPQTYQLTPTEVTALLGENNIWTDGGDVITVTYQSN